MSGAVSRPSERHVELGSRRGQPGEVDSLCSRGGLEVTSAVNSWEGVDARNPFVSRRRSEAALYFWSRRRSGADVGQEGGGRMKRSLVGRMDRSRRRVGNRREKITRAGRVDRVGRSHQQDDDRMEEAIHFGRQGECWEGGKSVERKWVSFVAK